MLIFILLRRIKISRDWRRPLAVGLLGSLVVFLVHGAVDVPSYSPLSAIIFWGLFGLMAATSVAGDCDAPGPMKEPLDD